MVITVIQCVEHASVPQLVQFHQPRVTKLLENVHVCPTLEVPSVTSALLDFMPIQHVFHADATQLAPLARPVARQMVNVAANQVSKEDNAINVSQDFTGFQIARDVSATQPAQSLAQQGLIVVPQVMAYVLVKTTSKEKNAQNVNTASLICKLPILMAAQIVDAAELEH